MKYANMTLSKKKSMPNSSKSGFWIFIIVLISSLGFYLYQGKKAGSYNPINVVGTVTGAELKESDGRTNILLLGSDQRNTGSETGRSVLTDTILLVSIGKLDKDVVLISLPRDLWVQWKTDTGIETYSKINAVYDYTTYEGTTIGGIDNLNQVIEDVLGVPVHYYSLVTFDLFKEVIDILGGVEIDVENAFTDYEYPIEGKENAPENERYEVLHFDKGTQTMDGTEALKYVRSRKGDNGEGTDFARSKRQQKVIAAIKNKAMSAQTLLNISKITDLYKAYAKNVDTNVDIATVQGFYTLSTQIQFDKVTSVVLDDRSEANDGGLLYAPTDRTLYGGQYVLIPQTGNYNQIHAFVQRYFYGQK